MITDKNKHITSIENNHLNLPTRVVFDNQTGGTNDNVIEYVYDAAGVKQAKIVTSYSGYNDNYINTTQYAGNFVYKGTKTVGSIGLSTVSLEFFNHPEGYIEPYKAGKATLYRYIYQMKDHLGNIRVSYCDYDKDGVVDLSRKATDGTEILLDIDGDGDFENEIVQTKHYYPFGLQHNYGNNSPMSVVNGRDHKYGYNGIEKEESFDFNMNEMDMRFYDSALARWVVQDPIIHFGYSPYNAFDNNPIYWADPSGADATQTEKGVTYTGQDAVNALRQISMSTTATNGSGDDEVEENEQKISIDLNSTFFLQYEGRASFILTGSLALGLAIDTKGNTAIYSTATFGGGITVGANTSWTLGFSSANDLSEFKGWGAAFGIYATANAGIGAQGAAELNFAIDVDDNREDVTKPEPAIDTFKRFSPGISVGIPIEAGTFGVGVGGYAEASYTKILFQGNVSDAVDFLVSKIKDNNDVDISASEIVKLKTTANTVRNTYVNNIEK